MLIEFVCKWMEDVEVLIINGIFKVCKVCILCNIVWNSEVLRFVYQIIFMEGSSQNSSSQNKELKESDLFCFYSMQVNDLGYFKVVYFIVYVLFLRFLYKMRELVQGN